MDRVEREDGGVMESLFLAPLQGLTDATFRMVFSRYFTGLDRAYAPFISMNCANPVRRGKLEKQLSTVSGFSVVPQLLTNEAKAVPLFAQMCRSIGFPMINLNMGCPYGVVTKKGKGAAMLSDVEKMRQFMDVVFEESEIKLSLKMRLGIHHAQEAIALMPLLNHYPIEEIIIHPRIGDAYYTGTPDMEAFSQLLSLSKHPIIYNGDIFSKEEYQKVVTLFPQIKGVMLGRGILQNPWLSAEIKGLPISKNRQTLLAFTKELARELSISRSQGERFPQGIKEHWRYLSLIFEYPEKVFDKIKYVNTFDEYEKALDYIVSEIPFKRGGEAGRCGDSGQ